MKALRRNDGLILHVGEEITEVTIQDAEGNDVAGYKVVDDPYDSVKDYSIASIDGTETIIDLDGLTFPADIAVWSKYFEDGGVFTLNPDHKGS